jgi:hypothetical protein
VAGVRGVKRRKNGLCDMFIPEEKLGCEVDEEGGCWLAMLVECTKALTRFRIHRPHPRVARKLM